MSFAGKTAGEGPILFGVAANYKDAAAIAAALNSDIQSPQEDDSRGKGNYLQVLGYLPLASTNSFNGNFRDPERYMISWGKNGWSIPEDQSLVYWAFNTDGSAITTGASIQIAAEHFGVWLRD